MTPGGAGPLAAYDLTGRVAIVTGAASGIGRASAEFLAAAGATVVCADRDEEGAGRTAGAIGAAGGSARPALLDVADPAAVDALVADTVARGGRLDVVANVAGIIRTVPVAEMTDEELEAVLAVNLKGVVHGCRAAARVMAPQGSGAIVNMASAAVDAPAKGLAAYGMAKAAVVQLTRVLATELAPDGVRVNAVAPGFVETAMTARRYTAGDGTVDEARRAAVLDGVARGTPLRTVGAPEDVAHAVLYLASDAARFVTGQILRPNGGVAMPW
ncbi:MAG TPA: SDR family NAD(P)-dependent oxidoreductase [Acidimicrobiales bacterium]|nr:SDR family NAD(P)-dependent oxidoreductase [Acidimicrobiales bacterium]